MKELNSPQAAELMASTEDKLFVDVRSVQEFVQGHPDGAVNVPVAEPDQFGQMAPNPDFVQVVKALAPSTDTTLVFTCRSGQRSRFACELLASEGYGNLVNVEGGWAGNRNPYGQVEVEGWEASGLPGSTENGDGIGYESVRKQALGEG